LAAVAAARVADFAAFAVLFAAALVVLLAADAVADLVVLLAGRLALDPVFGGMVGTPCWILAGRSLPVGFGRLARSGFGRRQGVLRPVSVRTPLAWSNGWRVGT
jgi:hypothetical protein